MPDSHYIDNLFEELPEVEKLQILREAGIFDDRPSVLRGLGGAYGPVNEWMDLHRRRIIPVLLRTRNLSDDEIAHLVSDGDLSIGDLSYSETVEVNVSFSLLNKLPPTHEGSKVLLTDLAAASAMMTEMFVVIGNATRALGAETSVVPPHVRVESGSVEIAVGGGLFGSGMGLIVACAAGLVAAPVVGPAVGVVLASAGIIELALEWKQKIAETEKTKEETRVLRIDHDEIVVQQSRRLRELDIRLKEIELEKAKLQARTEEKGEASSFAPSGLVRRDVVIAQAEQWGLTETASNHILNRALAPYTALRRYFAQVHLKNKDVSPK